jgi:hypothetical protein
MVSISALKIPPCRFAPPFPGGAHTEIQPQASSMRTAGATLGIAAS